MTDNAGTSLVRAFEKLRETVYNTPFSPNTNDAHLSNLRADVDALKEEIDTFEPLPKTEQRSNGSHDLDEPMEHTDEYKDRTNDWLGYLAGGELTTTKNREGIDEQKAREAKAKSEDEKRDEAAQGKNRDDVSNGPDQRKIK